MAPPTFPSAQRPEPGKQEIDLFLRALHTLLRSSGEVQLRALSEVYLAMQSSLHIHATDPELDLATITYTSLRLPPCIDRVRHIVLGQTDDTFRHRGFPDVDRWTDVGAPGRRRKMRFDGAQTLAVSIASPSDIDDLIPLLLAFEIEWNKLHHRLVAAPGLVARLEGALQAPLADGTVHADLLAALGLPESAWERLQTIWGGAAPARLLAIAGETKHFGVRLLGGSRDDFRRAIHVWWRNLEGALGRQYLTERPIYFVSSNTHALVNLLSGVARRHESDLLQFVEEPGQAPLRQLAADIRRRDAPGILDNFLYYTLRQFLADPRRHSAREEKVAEESAVGITTLAAADSLVVDAQVIELKRLHPGRLDPRVRLPGLEALEDSDALILNVDYPLGYAAYQLLHTVSYHTPVLLGLYVMGKAATLNGRVGDVMVANTFLDEHSGNTYLVDNVFIAEDIAPYLVFGSALDNQQAVAVRGTYLQNHRYLDELYHAGYTVVEMEAGPYLDAVFESTYMGRYPNGDVVNLYGAPYEVGIVHYASDTPFSRGHNLGAQHMSYFGMDPTYAVAVAIIRRILQRELTRLAHPAAATSSRRVAAPLTRWPGSA